MPRTVVGNYLSSLQFNGTTSFVQLGTTGSIGQPTAAFTLACRFRPYTTTGVQALVAEQGPTLILALQLNSAKQVLFSIITSVSSFAFVSTTRVNSRDWHQVVVTYDGANIRMIIDGQVDATVMPVTGTRLASTDGINFGRGLNSTRFYGGYMAEVRYWQNRSFSNAEALSYAQGGINVPGLSTGLSGEWYLNEVTGTTAIDTFGNNGTITAGTYSTDVPTALRSVVSNFPAALLNVGTTPTTGNSVLLDARAGATVVFAYKLRGVAAGNAICGFQDAVPNSSLRMNLEAGTYRLFTFQTNSGGTGTTGSKTTTAIVPNRWYKIAYTYDGAGGSQIFVDDVLWATGTGNLCRTSTQFFCGTGGNGGQTLSNIRVWQRKLSNLEIQQASLGDVDVPTPVLIWRLTEGAGTSLIDSSGNGLSGIGTGLVWTNDTPSIARKVINGNLVKNGSFEYAPPFTAATTASAVWVNGTAVGESGDNIFGWATTGNVASGSFAVQYDTSVSFSGTASMKVSTKASNAAAVAGNIRSTTLSIAQPDLIRVSPNTTYSYSLQMKTNYVSGDSNDGAYVNFKERTGSGSNTTTTNSTKVKTTTNWTQYTGNFTTASTTVYIDVELNVVGTTGSATLIMDAWFDDISLTPVFPEQRLNADGNLVLNPSFNTVPVFVAPQTLAAARFIDGTSNGSNANATYKWSATISNGGSVQYDSVTTQSPGSSLHLALTSTGSYIEIFLANQSAGLATYFGKIISVFPSTSYAFTYWMKTQYTSGDSANGANVTVIESLGDGTSASAQTTGAYVKVTQDWTKYTLNFTTSANTRFIQINPRVYGHTGSATLIMDAWFDDLDLRKTTASRLAA